MMLHSFRIRVAIASLIYSPLVLSSCFDPFGILGGSQNSSDTPGFPYGSLVGSEQQVLQVGPFPSNQNIYSVAMNNLGYSVLFGESASNVPFGASVSPTGAITVLPSASLPTVFFMNSTNVGKSVAINDAGWSLIGGESAGAGKAVFVAPNGAFSSISPLGSGIVSVDLNERTQGLVGGLSGANGFATYVYPDGTSLNLLLGVQPQINTVAINDFGSGIIAGGSPPYAALVTSAGSVSPLAPLPGVGGLFAAAINNSGQAILGGSNLNGGAPAYAAFVDNNGSVTSISSLPSLGYIFAVDINESGQALIGGADYTSGNGKPFAAFVSPGGDLTVLGPFPQTSDDFDIASVAINSFGVGLVGGGHDDGDFSPFAALAMPSGELISFNLGVGDVYIWGVDLIDALSQIPTNCLGGNNLSLAKYINEEAPEKAFYFLPALVNGTLSKALQSVAPTRNAAALYTTNNNVFMLSQSLSRHLREQRHFLKLGDNGSTSGKTASMWEDQHNLSAALDWDYIGHDNDSDDTCIDSGQIADAHMPGSNVPIDDADYATFPPYAMWAEVIGAFSYQKAEHQTPGFNPVSGGLILALEANLDLDVRVGGGAAYTYTHIHQNRGAGHAHIDQEYLFAYGFWGPGHFYLDAALWGGLFHIHQVRKIDMTAFSFRSTSDPSGWQLSPHLELGLDYQVFRKWFNLQPFAMFDWANSWQKSYKESGNGPFNMGQKSHYASFLRSELGIRFFETVNFNRWRLVFQEKASYVNKKPFDVGTVNAFLVGSPGSFTVETLSTPQNAGVGEFAMIFEPKDTGYPFGVIAYQGEFSQPYQSHQLFLEICWNF